MDFLTPSVSLRAVATTGSEVVSRSRRVRWNPIPLLAGHTNDHAILNWNSSTLWSICLRIGSQD